MLTTSLHPLVWSQLLHSCKYRYFIFTANWEDIKYEISCSNVIQRDNVMFAKKLDKTLVVMAKEKDKEVSVLTVLQTINNVKDARPHNGF